MSDLEKRIISLRAALAASPENIPLRLLLAETLLEADLPAQAIEEYQAVVRLDDNSASAHAALGKLYFDLKSMEMALDHLNKAYTLDPGDMQSMLLLSQAEAAMGLLADSDTDQAVVANQDPSLTRKPEPISLSPDKQDRTPGSDATDAEAVVLERPTVTFADVGGLELVKEQIRLKIIYPFQHPEMYQAYGKKAGGGILLYGPPGCGKTLLARATAGEVHANFMHVSITDILDMYLGETERKLHAIFNLARRKVPSVLFFDEVDAIGGKRLNIRENWLRAQVNQFLAELDGMEGSNEQLLIIGATNSPWTIDSALMRPGRFDRVVFVPPPDYDARLIILKVHLQGKPVDNLDFPRLAQQTDGYSGADLMGLVETATEKAIQEAMRTGKVRPLTTDSLLKALRKTHVSIEEWFSTARDYATYANESGFFDDVLDYIKKHKRK